MTEFLLKWVLTATALIAAVLLLRAAFGRRISARLRYALWAVVLVRLLVPVQLFTSPVETPQVLPEAPVVQTLQTFSRVPTNADRDILDKEELPVSVLPATSGEASGEAPRVRKPFDWLAALGWTWLVGSTIVAAAFTVSNWSFYRSLRRIRVPLEADGPLAVYVAPEGLPSPCLFGVLRPSVYLTRSAAADPAMFRHVLAHETTHFRHGDHVWSLLRCAALAVHWWNPLVWLAAVLSRRDAELACDEGALKRLGDGERKAYGLTLLALVTAKPRPGDLLRCATTMTGDKRSLQERVSRIARAPKRWLWAAVLAAGLAVLVCACAFARTAETPEDRPLTQEELDRFNSEVFNGDGFNIRNQFLFLAVEAPQDYRQIDLYQLFYNGTGEPGGIGDEERLAVVDAAWGGEDPGVDLVKCPAVQMNEILQEYLGLTLEETDKWGLDQFTYLEEYDAYYHFCGDTNYPGNVTFTSGEYKDGKLLLYYQGNGYPVLANGDGTVISWDGFMQICLTLELQKDGGFRFLTNWQCDPSAHPTAIAYPDRDPELVIPLDGLEPYQPEDEDVVVERFTGEKPDYFKSKLLRKHMPYVIEFWRDGNHCTYAGIQPGYSDQMPTQYFLKFEYDATSEQIEVKEYSDICGHSGFSVEYPVALGSYVTAYYYLDEDDHLHQLVNDTGFFNPMDLDGDGQKELIWSPHGYGDEYLYLLFQRDGQLYKAEIKSLIRSAWPEVGYISGYGIMNKEERYISFSVELPLPDTDITVSAYRDLWFDGENFRLYKDADVYSDHVKADIEAPEDVLAAARDFVQEKFETLAEEGYGTDGSGNYSEENFGPGNVVWDDWHITDLTGPYYDTAGEIRLEIWNVGYETHTTTPDRVMLAGGSYLGEDGWCMIGYPVCDYLYFQLDSSYERTFLYSRMENDCFPGTEGFHKDIIRDLERQGISLAPSKETVLKAREQALKGMSEEQIDRLNLVIKEANLWWEHMYLYFNIFETLEDPNALYWNCFEKTGEIQIGWAVDGELDKDTVCEQEGITEDEFYAKYGTKVVSDNKYTAYDFVSVMEELRIAVQNERLKADLEYLQNEMAQARETHRMKYANNVYKKLHDLDYFLLRYGPEDVGKYMKDTSTVSKYYGTLTMNY